VSEIPDVQRVITRVPERSEITDALAATWQVMANLAADFDEAAWATGSPLPGWTVRDVYAHIVGAERMLAGAEAPEVELGSPAHVRNEIGRANEAWIRSFNALTNQDLLAEFIAVTNTRVDQLRAMTDQQWDAPSWTPAGDATLGRWLHIRVFDSWMHEQDVRIALGRPGGRDRPAADLSLLEVVNALGYIIGKRGEAEPGSMIEFRLFRGSHTLLIHVAVESRAEVVPDFDDEDPTTVLAMNFEIFMRLAGGRRSARASIDDGLIEIGGDRATGERLIANLAFTI